MTQAGRFTGRVVVVTGGGSGVGAAVARGLAAEGATVVVLGRDAGRLDDVVRLAPAGSTIVPRVADVGDEQAVTTAVDAVAEQYGRLDTLVHAAAAAGPGAVDALDTATWRAVVATDLDGVFFASRAALPHLRAVGGSIVSVVPTGGGRGRAATEATRAAVVALTGAVALDHAHEGVRANTVQVAPPGGDDPPRGAARPEDVASVVAFLASDDARSVTGALVRADGGPPA